MSREAVIARRSSGSGDSLRIARKGAAHRRAQPQPAPGCPAPRPSPQPSPLPGAKGRPSVRPRGCLRPGADGGQSLAWVSSRNFIKTECRASELETHLKGVLFREPSGRSPINCDRIGAQTYEGAALMVLFQPSIHALCFAYRENIGRGSSAAAVTAGEPAAAGADPTGLTHRAQHRAHRCREAAQRCERPRAGTASAPHASQPRAAVIASRLRSARPGHASFSCER